MARVVLEHVNKVFHGPTGEPVHAVRDITLDIGDGQLVVLVGPSGCGKTTTLRLIAGLEDLTAGTISIDGRVVNQMRPKERDIAMVFQHHALYPHMTVYDNMAFALRLRKRPKAEIDSRVREASELLGLSGLQDRLPEALSGGERQRVAVGRAVVRHPKAFLLDEPLSNLDPPMRTQMRLELKQLHERLAATMVYVTHDQIEALTLGDNIVVMNQGAVQQIGCPMAVYQSPANMFVAGFIGSPPMNFANGVVEAQGGACFFRFAETDGTLRRDAKALQLPDGLSKRLLPHGSQRVIMGLRPEDMVPVSQAGSEDTDTTLEAVVELVEPVGPDLHLHMNALGWRSVWRWPLKSLPRRGEELRAQVAMSHARFFDPDTGRAIVLD